MAEGGLEERLERGPTDQDREREERHGAAPAISRKRDEPEQRRDDRAERGEREGRREEVEGRQPDALDGREDGRVGAASETERDGDGEEHERGHAGEGGPARLVCHDT